MPSMAAGFDNIKGGALPVTVIPGNGITASTKKYK
jgi:hypothetical protein